MYSTSEFRNGLKIELDDAPFEIVYFQAVNPGKGAAFTRTKLKNLLNGNVIERTFKSGEKVRKPDLEEHQMQYLYRDESGYMFMNTENYEQESIPADIVGDDKDFLIENAEVNVLFYRGRPMGLSFPFHMVFTITHCEPGVRGDTATGTTKPATCETGLVVQVPLFVNEGERIKVDTRSRAYIERVNR
ncbi:MAG: elongation factor P [Myxococcales bacterium]|nr:MAG: elongation factor P [Myxococcales bacterium]